MDTETVGKIGESITSRYLEEKGGVVIARNYRRKWGEIDIVARFGETIHFVEVKTVSREIRGTSGGYMPEENVHPQKLRRLRRAIQSYLRDEKISKDTPWQLDVAGVFLDAGKKKARIRLTENVVLV